MILPLGELPRSLASQAELVALVRLPRSDFRRLFGGPSVPAIAREDRAIVALLADGTTVTSVAHRLGMSERTVYRRLAALRKRLGVNSITELAARINPDATSDDRNTAVGVRGSRGSDTEPGPHATDSVAGGG